jgi:hypothetical protein
VTTLFERLGVDYVQWRALVRAYIWIDYAALFGAFGRVEARRTAFRLALGWGFLSLTGLGLAGVAWAAHDPFLAAAIVTTTMMMWSGMIALPQQAGLATPDDHDIIGFRPVTSRTFFAVRVTALLVPVLETIALTGWLPVFAFLTRDDGGVTMAIAAAAAFTCSATTITLTVVAAYGWLIRIVPPARLTRVLAYAGGLIGIILVAGIMFGMEHLVEADEPGAWLTMDVSRDWRIMWFPATWFAAYVPIAGGVAGWIELATATLSVVVLATTGALLHGRVSLDYASRVASFASISLPRSSARERTWRWVTGENRAVAVLVWSHLRRDVRFQLAVATNLAMGVIFTMTSSSFRTPGSDPFTGSEAASVAPLFALLFVPTQIYQALVSSTSHEASWLFFSTPADRTRLVSGARDAVGAFVLLPVSLLLAMFYTYQFGHAVHALLHATFLGLMAYASLQLNVFLTPRLPFSTPMLGQQARGIPVYSTILLMLIAAPFFVVFQLLAYRGAVHAAVGLVSLLVVNLTLHRLTRRRIARRASTLVYLP